MRIVSCFLVLSILGCASINPFDYVYYYRPYQNSYSKGVKILSSNLKITEINNSIKVKHRVYYRLISGKNYIEVMINRRLKDFSGTILAQKGYKDVQRSGVYPNTFEFKLPINSLPKGWFLLETIITTYFGTTKDTKIFSFNKVKKAYDYKECSADVYKYLFSSESCPDGFQPVAREITDASNNILKQWIECLSKKETQIDIGEETGIYYPRTGKYYQIYKSQYPEFYKKCDLDGDGIIRMDELGHIQNTFNAITAKYPEGDIDSVVKEFIGIKFE